jgi:penicillin-binding protein 1A
MTAPIKRTHFSSSQPSSPSLKKRKRGWKFWLLRLLGAGIILSVLGFFILWATIIRTIPPLENLENGNYFRESSVIYDSNGQEIYNLFKDGKRTYIQYDDIAQVMKDAIISTEDRTFFENPGIDVRGLFRAGLNYAFGKTDKIKWTSTLSQQLISVTLLSKERSIKRKVQEAYLSYKLNKEYSKEKILEMYLNAISFWSNANGIEQASRTFFGKSASELGPLSATILASLPKWPTYYSPYAHRDRLMGAVNVYSTNDPTNIHAMDTPESRATYEKIYSRFETYLSGITFDVVGEDIRACNTNKEYIKNATFSPDKDGCVDLTFDTLLPFVGNIAVKDELAIGSNPAETYIAEYMIGRKDFVASQMLEDGKIDGPTFKKILYDGLSFSFRRYTENIKHPYFVMYVKEYLEEKYGNDLDITNGLKIYTTIDPVLQEKAEELLTKQVEINKKQFGASSAALVSMDNKDGKLLAMVGWPDYFDTENGGNNNMAIALRQPGSSFKPLVYALAVEKNPIGPETPIADIKTKFWNWEPNNYDMKYNGIMMVKTALDYSRNIPAAKMFYLAGGEETIVKFWKEKWGLTTLKENAGYGAPLAIGSAEVRPIDLMQAYSVLANNGIMRDVFFIAKIEDSDGNILEEHILPSQAKDPVLSPGAAYIINSILSNNDARPESTFWRNALTIPGRTVAAKTGTSNKEITKDKILPRDLWTVGYTPQITTAVWAGNVNGKETKGTCDGLNCAAPIWKGFMEFALKNLPKEEFEKPKTLFTYNIVKTSGKLATENTPKNQIISTVMAMKLTEYDEGFKEVQIDTLCNGPISENTPPESIKTLYIPNSKPIIDGFDPTWLPWFYEALKLVWSGTGSSTESQTAMRDTPCERPSGPGNISISINTVGSNAPSSTNSESKRTVEIWWIGDRNMSFVRVFYKGELKREVNYGTGAKNSGKERISLTLPDGDATIKVEVVDVFGFTYNESRTLLIGNGESSDGEKPIPTDSWEWPTISLLNPKGKSLSLYAGDVANLRFRVDTSTASREIVITIDDILLQSATSWDLFVIPLSSANLTTWNHTVKIVLTDGNFKTTEKSFILTILPR